MYSSLTLYEGGEEVFGSTYSPEKAHGFRICVVNRADSRILKTQWIVDQLYFLTRNADCGCLMFGSWVLNEIWITDLSSALIGMLMSLFRLFVFLREVNLSLGVRLSWSEWWCCHQACYLLYYLGEINSGIHMYQFTFEPLHFLFSNVVVVSDLKKNFG